MLLIRSGTVLHFSVTQHIPSVPFERGAVVGHVTGVLNGTTSVTWRVIATTAIAAPRLDLEALSTTEPALPGGVGSLRGFEERGQHVGIMTGEIRRDAQALNALLWP